MTHKTNSPENKTDWITPKYIIDALGEFDLDPCCPAVMPWRTAKRMVANHVIVWPPYDSVCVEFGNGLWSDCDAKIPCEWLGRVWLNPPYGREQDAWLEKLAAHGNGIALIPAATETRHFDHVWGKASAICFVRGRVNFCDSQGNVCKDPGNNSPSALIAYGAENAAALRKSGLGAVCACTDAPHGGKR